MTKRDFENKSEAEVKVMLQRATPEQLLRLLKSMKSESRL